MKKLSVTILAGVRQAAFHNESENFWPKRNVSGLIERSKVKIKTKIKDKQHRCSHGTNS